MIRNKNYQLATIIAATFLALISIGSNFAWKSVFIIPMLLILLLLSFNKGVALSLYKPTKVPAFYIFFIFLICYFVFRFDFMNANSRSYVELISLSLYFIVFSVFSKIHSQHRISSSLFSFFASCVLLSIILGPSSFGNTNKQIYAYTFFISLPFIVSYFNYKTAITFGIIFTSIIFQLFAFQNRTASVSLLTIIVIMFIWSWLSKRNYIYFLFVAAFLLLVISAPIIYTTIDIDYYDQLSREYFNKGIDGRSAIWFDLLFSISENPWIGKCSNCAGIYSFNLEETRNLSSHNTFLEILFRVGIPGLVLFILMLFGLFKRFLKFKNSSSAKFGAAYTFGAIIFMSGNEFSLTLTFTANLVFWAGLGLVYGQCKDEHLFSKITRQRVL